MHKKKRKKKKLLEKLEIFRIFILHSGFIFRSHTFEKSPKKVYNNIFLFEQILVHSTNNLAYIMSPCPNT